MEAVRDEDSSVWHHTVTGSPNGLPVSTCALGRRCGLSTLKKYNDVDALPTRTFI
jgi:hypothetical protein